jgi:hypothetical protein
VPNRVLSEGAGAVLSRPGLQANTTPLAASFSIDRDARVGRAQRWDSGPAVLPVAMCPWGPRSRPERIAASAFHSIGACRVRAVSLGTAVLARRDGPTVITVSTREDRAERVRPDHGPRGVRGGPREDREEGQFGLQALTRTNRASTYSCIAARHEALSRFLRRRGHANQTAPLHVPRSRPLHRSHRAPRARGETDTAARPRSRRPDPKIALLGGLEPGRRPEQPGRHAPRQVRDRRGVARRNREPPCASRPHGVTWAAKKSSSAKLDRIAGMLYGLCAR